MTQDITFDIIARDKASKTFDKISHSSSRTQSRLLKFGKVAAASLAATGVVAVSTGVKFAKMAIEDQASAAKLAKAMQNNAHATRGQISATEDWITAQGKAYGVADDNLRPALGKLVAATHSVEKSQRLASLAMNVSAGTGKSLEAVSFALAKAQAGNVSGLSRLGIATKDAAGKTKSLKQITEELAKTYRGQAATAANTAQGKFNRVKLELSETAESIGYKLLPAATKLGDWLLNKGIPAVQKFGQQMHDGTGAGGEFVDILKETADVGKTALRILNELPGPVKKFGIEGLIAYGVLRKMTAGTTSLGASMVMPIARTKQFYAEMTYADTRMQKLSTTSRALGGALRQVGGTAGMLAVVDGAQRSNKAIGALETTAGAAAAGFAVGGPWGAAIGGAVGGLVSLYKAVNKGTTAAKISIPSWKEYAQTLSGVSAATTKATRDMAFQRLESSGLLAATRALGLTDRQAVNAMMGQTAARKKLAEAMRTQNTITNAQKAALERETGAVGAARLAQLQHNVAVAGSRAELQKARKALQDFMKEPASKKVSITGIEATTAQLASLRAGLRDALGLARDLNTAGSGGIGTLLSAPLHPRQHRRAGGSTSPRLAGGFSRGGSVSDNRLMQTAGERTSGAYAEGIHIGATKVKNALSKLQDLVSKAADKLANLKEIKSGFLSTFSSDSIFGADLSGGGGINALMDFEQKQATKAQQLLADVQKVASMGLSKSLIAQLQSAGSSGADQLHALAGGTTSQIQALNALDVQTSSALQAAGMVAGNYGRGGSINADIAHAQRQEDLLQQIVHELRGMNGDTVVRIDAETIIKIIKVRNKRKGVAQAGI